MSEAADLEDLLVEIGALVLSHQPVPSELFAKLALRIHLLTIEEIRLVASYISSLEMLMRE